MSISRRRTDQFGDAEFLARVQAEVAQARVLYSEGVIRQIWQRADTGGVCILLEAESEAHAREKLNTLPLVAAGMLDVTLIPLKPYAGFCT